MKGYGLVVMNYTDRRARVLELSGNLAEVCL